MHKRKLIKARQTIRALNKTVKSLEGVIQDIAKEKRRLRRRLWNYEKDAGLHDYAYGM